jgi:hypothetical protein
MLELTKSAMSLSWGLSLLGAQQAMVLFPLQGALQKQLGALGLAGTTAPQPPAQGPGPGAPVGPPDYFKEFSVVPGWGPMPTRKP